MLNKFFKRTKYITVSHETLKNISEDEDNKPYIPNGMWIKCSECKRVLYKPDLDRNNKVCQHCGHHFRMNAWERIRLIMDKDSFEEFDADMQSDNPIEFDGYEDKLDNMKKKTGLNEAVVTGKGTIGKMPAVACFMDSNFMMGSMGSVVGEKITRAIENSIKLKLPIIIFTTSGGARMQEGIFSLMQMAKISAALSRLDKEGLLYITVLTDPTTGGVTASFAMLGDIILAEPHALVGFAGKRVIEQTIHQKLPEGFQSAEFLLQHGFIDRIVSRDNLKSTLKDILVIHDRGR
ncbi:MAG: acetyl-CoA carboxylase, carboxyltransferase subunit beta [Clostridium sp.]|uniref:acetyl-CoA carboxylase, carboxyltransferase subunit beta n=1 Tax=Clostridium sp. TaxID=1506 RepID=UPI0025B7E897|nr:acetyl-CoA carboxylase, carboxyltransferase subunit beta [Clostridium sp.]MCH3965573.1 acetyl-CoA carboxylase, carboxyltransferase subunit beta [Clostridium sp.]MCI1716901.1 acetyl-CoA carboxylase, carboxyltransferase subunit beta [Clostridium sp.]MCI1801169.1 acetyl-CoA carboxylase, carboxyltransferase subunit beta [Clostridium sp.]MCI1815087.1 acetyl-CoA carboxylase, carboxyltransferase subunit beta [Clostridium sp.]MCI1871990.1 acetyl-CoA carboxylase, carboxyltransferase subunit beta [Cl